MNIVEQKMPRFTAERNALFRVLCSVIRNSRTTAADRKTCETHHLAPQGMAGFVLANGSMEQVGNSF